MSFRMPSRVRLNLVRPLDEDSTGKPVSARASYKGQRVTADASFNGALSCALIEAHSSGSWARNFSIGRVAVLQGTQAGTRLLTRFDPPRTLGMDVVPVKPTSPQ